MRSVQYRIVARRSFRLTSVFGMSFLFYPNANVKNILKRVFSHDLFNSKLVFSSLQVFRVIELDPVLIDVVHAGSFPSTFAGCQGKIQLKLLRSILPWSLYVEININVTVIVFFVVTKHKEGLVLCGSVLYDKIKRGPKAVLPCMMRDWRTFFVKIDSVT